jgi:hypothetical protein
MPCLHEDVVHEVEKEVAHERQKQIRRKFLRLGHNSPNNAARLVIMSMPFIQSLQGQVEHVGNQKEDKATLKIYLLH